MSERITVVWIKGNEGRPVLGAVLEGAVRVLNYSQTEFHFETGSEVGGLRELAAGESYSWAELEGVLEAERCRLQAKYLIGVLDEPIENNWFSRAIPGKNVIFITTWCWEYLSDLPVGAFVAYEMVENLVELLVQRDEGDQEWLFNNVVHKEETRGCLSDMCTTKPHISFKIRTGDICPSCMEALRSRVREPAVEAIQMMLEAVRKVAIKRVSVEKAYSSQEMLAELIDQRFPFPIAYCFRAMRGEMTYLGKWKRMYDLYLVIVRYMTFVLLAERQRLAREDPSGRGGDRASGPGEKKIQALSFASDGKWGEACFALVREVRASGRDGLLARFFSSFDDQKLAAVEAFSRDMVRVRNNISKGIVRVQNDCEYQGCFERHMPGLKGLLHFLKPLAGYPLVSVTGGIEKHGARCRFRIKRLVGSNPLFSVVEVEGGEAPDTGCLLDCGGAYLTLYPWLQLDYCRSCYREMVFVYDRLDGYGTSQQAVLREYPTNHEQFRADLRDAVREGLGVKAGRPGQ